jgi:hypothetical protein
MMWAALGLVTHFRRRDGGWLALFTGLMLLAGHAQTAWYTMLLVGLFAVWYALTQPLTPPFTWWWDRLRRIAAVAALMLLGAGIAALQLIPTAELLLTSSRDSGLDYDFAVNFSYHPLRSLNMLSPYIFGNPAVGTYNAQQGVFFEFAVYIGLLPLVAAFSALFGWLRNLQRDPADRQPYFKSAPFWWIIVIVAFALAMGRHSPVFPFLYRHVPTFDMFQGPVRWHLWTVFALSVLAGIGVNNWGRGARVRRWARLATVACLGIVMLSVVALIVLDIENDSIHILLVAMITTGAIAVLTGILTLRQPDPTTPHYGRWSLLVLIVITIDLSWAAWGLNPTVASDFYARNPTSTAATDSTGLSRIYWTETVENSVKFDTYFRFDDYRIASRHWQAIRRAQLPNLNLVDRAYLLNNFDPLQVGDFADYLDLVETGYQNGAPEALLQAAGAETYYDEFALPQAVEPAGTRAWLVDAVCWHESRESLEDGLLSADWNPQTQIHMLGDGGCPDPGEPEAMPSDAILLNDEANRVTLEVNAPRYTWLVLADTDYPGWTATVDDKPVPIYRANLAFRAVQIPAGQHTVTFAYQARWLLPGAVITALALLGTLVLFRAQEISD